MKTKTVLYLLVCALLLTLVFSSAYSCFAQTPGPECATCHGNKWDFTTTVSTVNCSSCHPVMDNLRAQHYGGTTPSPAYWDNASYNGYGSFQAGDPLSKTPLEMHDFHRDRGGTGCVWCHATSGYWNDYQPNYADCDLCHVNVAHANHGNVAPVTVSVINNIGATYPNQLFWKSYTCLNPSCHGSPPAFQMPSCSTCHPSFDHTAAHDKTIVDNSTCNQCHVGNAVTEHIDNHGKNCDTCHKSTDPLVMSAIERGSGPDGEDIPCSDCHGPSDHEAQHNMTKTDTPDCNECHDDNVVPDHLDPVKHPNFTCDTCHDPGPDSKIPRDTILAAIDKGKGPNGQTVYCKDCHEKSGLHYEAHEADPTLDSGYYGSYCVCHVNNLQDEHPRQKDKNHQNLTCDTCHTPDPNGRIPPAKIQAAIDSGSTNCNACHTIHGDPIAIHETTTTDFGTKCSGSTCHATNLGTEHSNRKLGCDDCHDYPGTRTNPKLNPEQVYNAIEINHNTKCEACHGTIPDHKAQHDKTIVDNSTCNQCHVANAVTEHIDNHGKNCKTCHESTDPAVISAIDRGSGPDGEEIPCSDCHGPNDHKAQHDKTIVDNSTCNECHVANAVTEHIDNHGKNCATCHESTDPAVISAIDRGSGPDGEEIPCSDCHGPTDHKLDHGKTIVDNSTCNQCHVANAVTEHIDNHGKNCDTCHKSTDPKVIDAIDRGSGPGGASIPCSDCHGTTDHTAAHDKTATDRSDCDICHKGNVATEHLTNQGLTCDTCHKSADPLVMSAIAKGSGTGGQMVLCSECHKAFHMDLNPEANASYHPAFDVGTNPMTKTAWVSPWTATSLTLCTDCHAVTSSYPVIAKDGSTVYLVGPYPHSTSRPSNLLCYNCHSKSVYGTSPSSENSGFGKYHKSEHDDYNCYVCHEVHGSSNARLITYRDAGSGRKWLTTWVQHSGNYQEEDCGSTHPECDEHPSYGISPASVTGKVTDGETGLGIKKAKIIANKYDIAAYTDSNGNYKLGNLYYGTYTITASQSGFVSQSQTATISRGQTVTLNFTLGQPGAITGKVTDANGIALSSATVSTNTGGYTALSNVFGDYTLSNVNPGTYTVTASKVGYQNQSQTGVTVLSKQTVTVNFALPLGPSNLALNKTASASGYESSYPPSYAFDGSTSTRWWKKSTSTQWIRVDLGSSQTISKVILNWHSYYAKEYKVQTSTDGSNWTTVYSTTSGSSGTKTITFSARSARYVRTYCTKANSDNGYSIYEFEVYQ